MPNVLERSYNQLVGTAASSGNNTLITGVAGLRLVIKDIIIQNQSANELTATLKNGSANAWQSVLPSKVTLSLGFNNNEEWVLDMGNSLVLNITSADTVGYSIRYYWLDLPR